MARKRGDYYKLIGDDSGVVFLHGRWKRFACLTCVVNRGVAKVRVQGPQTKAITRALASSKAFEIPCTKDHKKPGEVNAN